MVTDWLLALLFVSPTLAVAAAALMAVLARRQRLKTGSERARGQQLEHQLARSQRFEILGTLVAEISHDFNNVIAAILASCERYRENPDAEARDRYMAIVEASARRGGEIIDRLLHYSRRGDAEHPEVFDVRAVITDLEGLLAVLLPKRITLFVQLPPEPLMATFTPGHLFQILLNLGVNAMDAIEGKGGIILHAAAFEGKVHLEVSDTGAGIPEAVLPHIFEPLFTTKPEGKGSGLGLSVVKGLVEKGGGQIQVSSHAGQGTTFSLSLPSA